MMNLATCAGYFACQACTDCLKATLKQQVRLSYILFDGTFVLLTILITHWLALALGSTDVMTTILTKYIQCPVDQDLTCLGISSIYRISFALVIFHSFLLLFLFMRNGCSKIFNEEVWPFKILVVICLVGGFFFINNSFFETYSQISMILSLFFLIFQVVMIIDIFYLWGANWIAKYDAGGNFWMYVLVSVTVVLYSGTIYWMIRSYNWFGGCGIGSFANHTNLFFIILNTALIFAGVNPNSSLLTSGAVACYSTYLIWSGLSYMEEQCNPLLLENFTTTFHTIFGLVVIIASLVYVSVGSSDQTSGYIAPGGVDIAKQVLANNEPLMNRTDHEEGMLRRIEPSELRVYQENSFIYFHIIMLFASCYVAMLLTNWGSPVIDGLPFFQFQASKLSMWIKVGVAWCTNILYTWTLIAPWVLPDRDFS